MGLLFAEGTHWLLRHRIPAVDVRIKHLLWLTISIRIPLNRASVHPWRAEFLLVSHLLSHIVWWSHWVRVNTALLGHSRNSSSGGLDSCGLASTSFMGMCLFARNDVDQEIEHVRLGQCRCDVGPLQCAALVLLCVDPCPHGEFSDENVAAFGEENGGLCGYHLYLGICLHDLFDARQRELVQLIVVLVRLQFCNLLLPIRVKYIPVVASQALIDLLFNESPIAW